MNRNISRSSAKRTVSRPVLISAYAAAAIIVGLCAWQFLLSPAENWFYAVLALIAVGYVVFITLTNKNNSEMK